MRHLPNAGTMVGLVGWKLLAQASNEVRIKELMAKPCVECGALMSGHAFRDGSLMCPGPVK